MDTIASLSSLWLTLHLFALVLGLGGATYGDILMIRFLKDLKISHKEADVLRTLSHVVLVGIILATISGFFLFYPEQTRLLASSKFQAKLIIFSVLMVNGFFLHQLIMPKLVQFSFHKDHFIGESVVTLRHAGFAMGAISIISWYSVFLLGSLDLEWELTTFIGLYLGALAIGVITSLLIERHVRLSMKD